MSHRPAFLPTPPPTLQPSRRELVDALRELLDAMCIVTPVGKDIGETRLGVAVENASVLVKRAEGRA